MAALKDGNASDNKGPMILSVLWALTGLTTVLVIARMYIRTSLLHNLGSDDWLITASLVMGIVYCAITTINVDIGFGKHAWLLSERTVEHATYLNCLSFLFGIISFTIPKLAVTAMLNRILNPSMVQRICLWTLTGFAAVVSGICIIVLFTMCDPPEALWKTHLVTEGKATCKDVDGTAELVMWTNIESNVVIIASCIPTLQPVLELILGKRTTSSYNSRNRYKGSSQLPDSSNDHSKLSKPRKTDYEITTVGSQESILREEANGRIESHPMGAIRRTDNVTVEYESRSREDPAELRVSW
ncbi:hypothetical protein ASPNIDRAFT_135597 [Aspergillus niger ATCC 1015]|uniref:Rhodopsin domain-containing protein n=1 Tax=Aspergillus niger (strain ATCC 1015 / CBS 113.46 / FGSC A1144 / LSHB Ac4 / NCTC 3858a / NRRL 328 / USDA 3528.7) TaxID=380704 RepID=G3Y7N4_ASPNA|nr:hypothetical protein ASPNIDRAFT_135597 [Aspergillus niger ATCC 1015]